MSSNATDRRSAPSGGGRALTLTWIDGREALVVRWMDGIATVRRLESDVPPHHRATGHVRHEPGIRHGGGGYPQTAGEPRRLEHLERFLDTVAGALPPDDDLLILGPGTVHEHLARRIGDHDREHHVARTITTERAAPLTDRQLSGRLRRAMGQEPRRRTVGAYRWTRRAPQESRGGRAVEGRPVAKRAANRIEPDPDSAGDR